MPKLKDAFEQNLYQAFSQLGLNVHVTTESAEVDGADLEISSTQSIRFIGQDEEDKDNVSFLALQGDPTQLEGGSSLRSAQTVVFSREDTLATMLVKIKQAMHELNENYGAATPETDRDIPVMTKRDLEQRRDTLLDKLNALPENDPKRQQVLEQLKSLKAQLSLKVHVSSELEKFLIHKELGKFSTQQDGSIPSMNLWMDAIEEKASKVASLGFPLTSFQTALFTFLHEQEHYKQFQNKEVTAAELSDCNFRESDKCKRLEVQADEAAVNFIKAYKITFDPISLDILANKAPVLPKVGEHIQVTCDVDVVDTVYFEDGLHCGARTSDNAVDIGQYKISIKKGFKATINSVQGSKIGLIELSELGTISAFDPIRDRELVSSVVVHSCTVDLLNIKRRD